MSQRLGEWWRESQARADRVTMPGWARALYGALQAALRPVQARSVVSATTETCEDRDAYTEALKRWHEAQRRG